MQKKVSWGVLGNAKIARTKVIPAMQKGQYSEVIALASRDEAQAKSVASSLSIPYVHNSYEALLADERVEAVYIPLPNHLHLEWISKALAAGKHVLYEKPITLNVAEAEQLVALAAQYPKLKVMEAFMYRLHEQWLTAKRLVADGKIGKLRTVHAFFSYFNNDACNIRNQAAMGGGGLMDIGCYCVSLSRWLFAEEPRRVCALIENDPAFGVDRMASGMLDFTQGSATFTCSTQLVPYQRVNIYGTTGRIEIMIPFNAPPDHECEMVLESDGQRTLIECALQDQYTLQGDAFSLAILNDMPVPTPLSDAVANMRVLDRLVQSAKDERWC